MSGLLVRLRQRIPKAFGQPGNSGFASIANLIGQFRNPSLNAQRKVSWKRLTKRNEESAECLVEFFRCHGDSFQ